MCELYEPKKSCFIYGEICLNIKDKVIEKAREVINYLISNNVTTFRFCKDTVFESCCIEILYELKKTNENIMTCFHIFEPTDFSDYRYRDKKIDAVYYLRGVKFDFFDKIEDLYKVTLEYSDYFVFFISDLYIDEIKGLIDYARIKNKRIIRISDK